jgi:hypothetical protein
MGTMVSTFIILVLLIKLISSFFISLLIEQISILSNEESGLPCTLLALEDLSSSLPEEFRLDDPDDELDDELDDDLDAEGARWARIARTVSASG